MGPFHTNGKLNDPMDGKPLVMGLHPSGLPIRHGDAPSLVDRAALARAGVTVHARSKVFKIPDDIEKYVETTDWITKLWQKGGASIRHEQIVPDHTQPGVWHVWLSWVEMRGTIPTNPDARG